MKRPAGFPQICLFVLWVVLSGPAALHARPDGRADLDQGIALSKKGQWKEARDHFSRVAISEPYNEEASFWLARSLIHLHADRKDLLEARRRLEKCVNELEQVYGPVATDDLTTRKPPVPALALRLFYLGMARWGLDDRPGALSAFARALRAQPDLQVAAHNRISVLLEMGREGEASLEATESLKSGQEPAK